MSITDEKYLSLTTFRKNGEPKATPVWIVDLGNGTAGFTTASSSWKVKRLANDANVLVQPSDIRGTVKPGSSPIEATAVAVQGPEHERIRELIKGKYGFQFTLANLSGKVKAMLGNDTRSDSAVIITLP
ncbi:MAG: PPOX class F420-dependent oxidoreductase [Acidimicrobiales bacterium]|nr:MAG: PPOX class F420-dependent oxidoreductase [Acidimicrobiales bacterium]